jgi:hypothetical protein
MEKEKYDWIVVGGGISGIVLAEILCRGGKSVLLLEKNSQLASETSKIFHEWLHSGALYSLAPDKLLTLRYLLGATDDLFEYYSNFTNMNLRPTASGINVTKKGWFNNEHIEYRYKKHRFNPVWQSLVSRSVNMVDLVNQHDWLRRRAGSEYDKSKIKFSYWFNNIPKQIASKNFFYTKMSPDITMNSRVLISDILSSALNKGLKVLTNSMVISVNEKIDATFVKTKDEVFQAENVVVCSPDVISKLSDLPIKTSYAPIAIVENVDKNETSFVELDYNIKKCINLLKKGGGIGQAGGISVATKGEIKPYLSYIINEHKKRNPGIEVVDTYVGLKKELTRNGEKRNYLYHINQNSRSVWFVVLGKFSLAFSLAPEFYRRIYGENPPKSIDKLEGHSINDIISKTSWEEVIINSRREHGHDKATKKIN